MSKISRMALTAIAVALLLPTQGVRVALAQAVAPLGNPPTSAQRPLSVVPNASAISSRIWSPRLDSGYVPRGVAHGDGHLWVAASQRAAAGPDGGQCAVFKVNPGDGGMAGQFTLPAACDGIAGIAWGGDAILWVAAAGRLYRIDTRGALAAGQCVPMACNAFGLATPLRASFLAVADGAIWLGAGAGASEPGGRIWRLPVERVRELIDSGGDVRVERMDRSFAVDGQSVGAAIGPDGALWLAQSGSGSGRLQRANAQSGAVLAQWPVPAGIGDIDFGPQGRLWATSAAGSQGSTETGPFFPLIFAIDTGALK